MERPTGIERESKTNEERQREIDYKYHNPGKSGTLAGSRFKHKYKVWQMVSTGGQCVCLREQLINGLDYGGKLIKISGELLAKLFESCGAYKQSECIHS